MIGNVEEVLRRYDDALPALQQALLGHRALGNRSGEANDLDNIGFAESELGRYDEALAHHQQALAIHRALENRAAEAHDLAKVGFVESELGRNEDALASYQQALTIHRALENRLDEATDLARIGFAEEALGRYDDAIASYQQALTTHRTLENRLGQASDLARLADLQRDLGRYQDALASYEQALAIHGTLDNSIGEASDLVGIGFVESSIGRYDDALASYQRSLAIKRSLKDLRGEAVDLLHIGGLQSELGRDDDAIGSYQQALVIHRSLNDRRGEAADLGATGVTEIALGRYDDALLLLQQALVIHRAFNDRIGEAVDLHGIGGVEEQLGNKEKAFASFQQALAIYRALKLPAAEADLLSDIGRADERNGRYDDALTASSEAIELGKRLGEPEILWRSLTVEADADAHLGRRDAALAAYDAALEGIEGLRARLNQSERATYFAKTTFAYDQYISYLVYLNAKFPGQGYDRKALEVLERKSARVTLEQIGQSAARHFKGVPPEKIAEENADAAAVDGAQGLLAKLRSAATIDAKAESAAQRYSADAQARAAALDSSIKAQYPAYYQLRHPQPLLAQCGGQSPCLTISSFQQSVLRPGELMLVYDLLKEKSLLWLVDHDHVQLVSLAGSDKIDTMVAGLHAHVVGMVRQVEDLSHDGVRGAAKLELDATKDTSDFAAASYALYRMLIPDAAAGAVARAKSLIVIPSGSLYQLAFETLVTQDPTNGPQPHYLIEDAPVSYMPSASLLAVVRSSYAQPTAGRRPLLAFANPTLAKTVSGSAAPNSARGPSTYAELQLAAVRSVARSSDPSATGDLSDLLELPGTQTEAEAVQKVLDAPSASLIVRDNATRERVLDLNKSSQLKTYQYVLFATHAVLPSEIKGLTQPAIVLAHPERGDGLLTMADVFDLSLDADFVTLSACDTGVQTADSGGEGISGFTRAFLYAGTPAISVTLWKVDDEAAPQITPPFFAGMHSGKLTPAESLRQAKLAMLKSSEARFRHPYAWAPGVIFGDGDRAPTP